jgi:hypothetical protein
MSRNVLDGGPHTYFDDLESFFYVLCSVVSSYKAPGTPASPAPGILEGWKLPYASDVKHGWIVSPTLRLPVSPWFGNSIGTLCVRLHSFFKRRSLDARQASKDGRDPPPHIPSIDYDEFLQHIRQAISDMDSDDCEVGGETGGGRPGSALATEPAEERSDVSEPPRRPHKTPRRVAPVARPRRSKANYR